MKLYQIFVWYQVEAILLFFQEDSCYMSLGPSECVWATWCPATMYSVDGKNRLSGTCLEASTVHSGFFEELLQL